MNITDINKKAWEKVKAAAASAQFQVNSNIIGAKNLIIANYDGQTVIDAYSADERKEQLKSSHFGYCLLGYVNGFAGEAALVNMKDGTVRIFGKGKKSGKLTFIQNNQGNFTVFRLDDTDPNNKRFTKIAGTSDEVLVSIIIDIVKDAVADTKEKKELLDYIIQNYFSEYEDEQEGDEMFGYFAG